MKEKCPHNYSRREMCHKCNQPRDNEILFMRYRGYKLKFIGDKFGITPERVRQIYYKQNRLHFRKILKTVQNIHSIMKRLRAVGNNADLLQVQILHCESGNFNPS